MKKLFICVPITVLALVSCKKETAVDADCWWCNTCSNEPSLIVSGDTTGFSWTEYNTVRDACIYLERIVKSDYFSNHSNPVFEHSGDTLKVCGWLYNNENSIVYGTSNMTWISDNERYASGYEPYQPKFSFGDGIHLKSLSPSLDSIKHKCYVTGIVEYYLNDGCPPKAPCNWLRLQLNVIDVRFGGKER